MQGTLFEEPKVVTEGIEVTPSRFNKKDSWLYDFKADTAEKGLAASRLNWTVDKRPSFYQDENGGYHPVERQYHMVQQDGDLAGLVHGTVSDRYNPIQNAELQKIIDPLLESGKFQITQGGFTNYKRSWMMLDSGKDYDITGKGDNVTTHIMFHWCHDGNSGVRAEFVGRRVACSNAIQGLYNQSKRVGTGTVLNINHVQNNDHTMNLVAMVLRAQAAAVDDLVEKLKALAKTKLMHVNGYFQSVVPMPDRDKLTPRGYEQAINRRDKLLAEMHKRYEGGMGFEERGLGTAWAAYCAVGECVDHFMVGKTRTDPVEFRWFRGGSNLRIGALQEALNLIAA